MVRCAEGDDFLLKYLSNVANDYKCAVGLILGQIYSQKYNVIHFAKTPPFQTEEDKAAGIAIKALKNISEVKDGWIADHAKQTTRMLPGGMQILGIFTISDEDLLNPFNSKIKSILNAITKTCSAQSYLYENGDNDKIVLHFSSKSQRYSAKTYNIVTSNVQPAEFKFLQKSNKWVNCECTYQIDRMYYLKEYESTGPFKKHTKEILDDINKTLDTALILFDNDLKDVDEKLENIGKKKKVPRGSSNKISQDSNENKPIQVSIFEKCISENKPDKLEFSNVGGHIRIIGEIASKLWLNSKVTTIGDATRAVKEDIMRSLASRLEMHCDSLTEEEIAEDANSIHEPPRRVMITLPESNITVSDYLFPGEGPEDVKISLEELLDIKIDDDLELIDLEGQADISQYYKENSSTESEGDDFLPKINTDSSNLMYLLGLGAAILILIISIFVHFYMKS